MEPKYSVLNQWTLDIICALSRFGGVCPQEPMELQLEEAFLEKLRHSAVAVIGALCAVAWLV